MAVRTQKTKNPVGSWNYQPKNWHYFSSGKSHNCHPFKHPLWCSPGFYPEKRSGLISASKSALLRESWPRIVAKLGPIFWTQKMQAFMARPSGWFISIYVCKYSCLHISTTISYIDIYFHIIYTHKCTITTNIYIYIYKSRCINVYTLILNIHHEMSRCWTIFTQRLKSTTCPSQQFEYSDPFKIASNLHDILLKHDVCIYIL